MLDNNILISVIIVLLTSVFIFTPKITEEFNNHEYPNIIQTWKDAEIPEKYRSFVDGIKRLNPKSNYLFFDDNQIDKFIKTKFPQYYRYFKNFEYTIQKIDFFRYLAIYYYGGVYLDLDVSLFKSLKDIAKLNKAVFPLEYLKNSNKILKEQNFNGLIGNYAFYAPKGHPFIKKIIDNIINDRIKDIDYPNGFNYQRYVLYTTGPVMVTQSYIDFENKNEVKIIKPNPFRNFYFGNYGKHHLMGSWKNTQENFTNSYNKKYGIVLSCFNRPDYLKRTLNSLGKSDLSNSIICLIDDHSSDENIWKYIKNFKVKNNSCEIVTIRNNKNLGIRYSLKKGWDLLYPKCEYLCNIDSDVILKPDWLQKLTDAEGKANKIFNTDRIVVSGFNCTTSCAHKIIETYPSFYRKRTIGGINMFFNRETYEKLFYPVLSSGRPNLGWDWEICKYANNNNFPIIVTRPSVIQHIGMDGLNSGGNRKRKYDIAEDF